MFQKVLDYAGEWRKTTYAAMASMVTGILVSVVPYWFVYEIIQKILLHEPMSIEFIVWRIAGIAVCEVLYAFLYVKGLGLSHLFLQNRNMPKTRSDRQLSQRTGSSHCPA